MENGTCSQALLATEQPAQEQAGLAVPPAELMLKKLLAAHEAWFDVQRDYALGGRTFAGFAEFHSQGEQYVLIKRAKLWEVASHEYLFFDVVDALDAAGFACAVDHMKTHALRLVEPKPNHMCSNISLVVIAGSVDEEVERAVRKVRFRKNFKWGLWGWSDLCVAVVDLARGRILTNAAGKPLRATLQANLVPTANEE